MSLLPPQPASDAPIYIAIVEDDDECRAALVSALSEAADMRLVWAASSHAQAYQELTAPDAVPLDVVLVDLGLPDGSGLDLIVTTRTRWPESAPMVCTIFADETSVFKAMEAGALGYLLKDLPAHKVIEEIRHLHADGSPISPKIARKILMLAASSASATATATATASSTPFPPPDAAASMALSPREREVLRLIGQGHTTDEAARALGVTSTTVLTFVRRIYRKLQVNSRAEAIHVAHQRGFLLALDHPNKPRSADNTPSAHGASTGTATGAAGAGGTGLT
ncbi:response regulator transcription factor [Ottowia thiooxydans]|uniref:DNA-binding NarL/FixJ family response regulator n=1 Tax=Ottowia thiooxydans TaxID=219182 RepID=A0ABV2Q5F0_9BURK